MSIYAEINKNPSRSELFKFGLIFLAGMGVFGAIYQFKFQNPAVAQKLWIAGAVVLVLSVVPVIGRLLYIFWMGLGLTIGLVTSPIIMGIVYLIVIVPVGIIFRLKNRDTMRRQLDPKAKSYWEDYPGSDDPGSYIRQF